MTEDPALDQLNLEELNIMLAHVRLGYPHLRKYLSKKQIRKLLELAPLDDEQLSKLESTRAERSGHIALAFNTIITGSFGAWLGFSGFMRLSLDSLRALATITGIAMFASGSVGYFTFKLTNTNAKRALLTQRLHNLQLVLLRQIQKKRKGELDSLVEYLNECMLSLCENDDQRTKAGVSGHYDFETNESIVSWLNDLYKILECKGGSLKEEELYRFYLDRLRETSESIKARLSQNLKLKQEAAFPYDLRPAHPRIKMPSLKKIHLWRIHKTDEGDGFIGVLTNPTIAAPRDSVRKYAWMKDNLASIFVGLAPTLMGGFASMFVFLSGAPSVAKDFGLTGLEEFLRHPKSQMAELALAICLTTYYGFSHVYNNRKSYIRDHELEKTRKLIANDESKLIELNARHNSLEKARHELHFILDTYKALDIFASYSLGKTSPDAKAAASDARGQEVES